MHRVRTIPALLALVFALVGAPSVLGVESLAGASTVALPTVSGGFGSTPKITFPSGSPPTALQATAISKGTGATVAKGDLLVANYVGQIWKGKVFDSSFARHIVAAFTVSDGNVITGWVDGLAGKKVGSRVLLVIPPALGYGNSGNPQAGISGTDTLVFVVDLVAAYPKTIGSNQSATVVKTSAGGISVASATTTAPKVTVAKGTAKPKSESFVLLAKGSEAKTTKPSLLILQIVAYDWTGKLLESTWTNGMPAGVPVGTSQTNEFDGLVGDPIGSRVLMEVPAASGSGPYVLIVQIAGAVPASGSKS